MFSALEEAIAKFEGYGKPGTLATRNNNPGNIIAGTFANSHGAVGSSGGFAIFPDPQTGFGAMDDLLEIYANRGYSVDESIARWNGNGSNTPNYQDFVTSRVGTQGNTPLSDIITKNPVVSTATNIVKDSTLFFGMPWLRIAAFLTGLICLIVGLLGFKPVNDIVVEVKDKAVKAASVAATA